MPRPPKSPPLPLPPTALLGWAESLGEALGRGVARGINAGLSAINLSQGLGLAVPAPRRRGRPPKPVVVGPLPPERRCAVEGCQREVRSKGLCSAHYQAERRKGLEKPGAA